MAKYTVTFLLSLLFSLSYSQTCTINKAQLRQSFSLYPSKAQNLAKATLNKDYTQTISFKFPNSTTEIFTTKIIDCPSYVPKGVTISDVKITAIDGLPAGIEFLCDKPECFWEEATFGCVCIKGKPTQAGTYPLTVKVEGIANVLFMPISVGCTLSGYSLNVE